MKNEQPGFSLIELMVDNKTMELSPVNATGSIEWICTGGSVDSKYRPGNCR